MIYKLYKTTYLDKFNKCYKKNINCTKLRKLMESLLIFKKNFQNTNLLYNLKYKMEL